MIRRSLAAFSLIAVLVTPAAAQERVTVGTLRSVDNGALFLAAARGHFKAEGLDLDMTAYASDGDVAQALAGGATDFGLAGFTTAAFTLAGQGKIKAIAAQVREKRDYEGGDLVASNAAYARGLRKPEQITNMSAAIGSLGSMAHYQFSRIARAKGFDIASITLKPQGVVGAVARAVASGTADVAILPSAIARGLLTSNQVKLIAWVSELDEPGLGALFASATTIQNKRATVEKFLRAYRRGAADYYAAFLHRDKYGKRISNAASRAAATDIARYVYPGRTGAGATVEADVYFMDRQAQLDVGDVARQVEWYQAQGLIDKAFDPRGVVDLRFQ